MAECQYCGREFEADEALDAHLVDEHADELGPIDRRRIERRERDEGWLSVDTGFVALFGILGVATALVLYLVFFAGGGGGGDVPADQVAQTPTDIGSVHFHGTMNVTIEGERIDFSRAEYQQPRQFPALHFEGGDGQTWHGHARTLTLEYAMATLDIGVDDTRVTIGDKTYDGTDSGTTVRIQVNGASVDPLTYELRDGDHVTIVVLTSST